MAKATLTARTVAALKPEVKPFETTAKPRDVFDAAVPGFYVRVNRGGSKSFGCMYRVGGRLRRLTIGSAAVWSLADARERAREAIRLGTSGARDLASEKQDAREADTFSELAADYIERWAKPRKRSWREDERIIDRYLNPAFGSVKVANVRRADVRRLLELIAGDAPIMASRVLACARKIYNWAISQDLAETSPCDRVPAPAQAVRRDRVLSDDELRAVWTALDSVNSPVTDVYRLRLLTAQRGGEVEGMTWAEIDLTRAVWTIPADRSKNRMAHRVPLAPAVVSILERRRAELLADENRRAKRQGREVEPPAFVFPGWRNREQPITTTKSTARAIAEAAALDTPWTGHDLRRTAATRMAEAGTGRTVIGRVLNHAEPSVTAIYDRHGYDNEKREALDKWARTLARIVSGLEAVRTPTNPREKHHADNITNRPRNRCEAVRS